MRVPIRNHNKHSAIQPYKCITLHIWRSEVSQLTQGENECTGGFCFLLEALRRKKVSQLTDAAHIPWPVTPLTYKASNSWWSSSNSSLWCRLFSPCPYFQRPWDFTGPRDALSTLRVAGKPQVSICNLNSSLPSKSFTGSKAWDMGLFCLPQPLSLWQATGDLWCPLRETTIQLLWSWRVPGEPGWAELKPNSATWAPLSELHLSIM